MRVLVCGGRNYTNAAGVFVTLDALAAQEPIALIIHGAAQGADKCGSWWAVQRHVPQLPFPADWRAHGKSAGPIRNQQMLDIGKPDLVVAFPGGAGTRDMIARAKLRGVPVREFAPSTKLVSA